MTTRQAFIPKAYCTLTFFRWRKGNGTAEDWIKAYYEASGPENCEFQGYFYPECERCGQPNTIHAT